MLISYDQLRSELGNKERNIHCLAEYLENRADNNPNYSLFLGAGCSVTSGVRSASELVDCWKNEIYKTEIIHKTGTQDSIDPQNVKEYFESPAVLSWYDPRSAYSSLFEHKFNLRNHRRVFIEREVRDKNPSLGYAYLMHLVRQRYFNTIFTTNFDDLINEAFYQFSDERPIVCAHDSAISSITVTSQRPKIIKLHGDYLFEDIKSTRSETETLEDNMRNKFVEYAKDFGMIVVGYSGHDRSIMDVLSALLRQDHYFKHGIYWCLRRGAQISTELRKLFWNDRVFFVEIDGFDELMASLHNHVNEGELPIDTYDKYNSSLESLNNIISNSFMVNSASPIIQRDLRILKTRQRIDALDAAVDYSEKELLLSQKDEKGPRKHPGSLLTVKEKHILRNIGAYKRAKEYTRVFDIIESEISKTPLSNFFKKELLLQKYSASIDVGKKNNAIITLKELSCLEPKNVVPFLNLALLSDDFSEKDDYYEKAISIDCYDHRCYVEKAYELFYIYKYFRDKEPRAIEDELLKVINNGIDVFPAIGNQCYIIKFNFYMDKTRVSGDSKFLTNCSDVVDVLQKQDYYDPEVAKLRVRLDLFKKRKKGGVGFENTEDIKRQVCDCIERSNYKYEQEHVRLLIYYYNEISDSIGVLKSIRDYECKYQFDSDYYKLKSNVLLSSCRDLSSSIAAQEKCVELDPTESNKLRLVQLYGYASKYDEAFKVINPSNILSIISLEHFYSNINDYKSALDVNIERGISSTDYNIIGSRSFYWLKLKEYGNVIDLLGQIDYRRAEQKIPLLVNYELARVGTGRKIRKDKLAELQKENDHSLDQAVIAYLLGNPRRTLEILEENIQDDYEKRFLVMSWPVFEPLATDDRFIQLMEKYPPISLE